MATLFAMFDAAILRGWVQILFASIPFALACSRRNFGT